MGHRLFAVIFLLSAAFSPCVFAETDPPARYAAKTAAGPSAETMEEILDNQKEILKQLQEIRNELSVIKVRATR